MATPTHSFQEYIWLINIIHRMRGITFAEISTRWESTSFSNGRTFSRTTFNRHRDAIMDIFGINIACDRRTNGYYIENDEVFNAHSVQNWMISTLSVNNIYSVGRSVFRVDYQGNEEQPDDFCRISPLWERRLYQVFDDAILR